MRPEQYINETCNPLKVFERIVKNHNIMARRSQKRRSGRSIHTALKLAKVRWTGHVIRMPGERLPNTLFYGELQAGTRSQGGQRKKLQRHPQILTEELQHTIGVLGTGNTEHTIFQSGAVSLTKEQLKMKKRGTSRQRSGKGAIRKRFPLQKPRWEKTKLTRHKTKRTTTEVSPWNDQ